MDAFLDANADGLALALCIFAGLAMFFFFAMAVEWLLSRPMRVRRRRREAYRRYCDLIGS